MTKQMTPLNERIAEWFETKPATSDRWTNRGLSPKGAWRLTSDPDDCDLLVVEAMNFSTDESANAMLLEAMPEPELWVESSPGETKRWGCLAQISGDHLEYREDPNRKKAVV